ncbi:MAG: ATP-binding protein [Streptosporangiaceae bacterium]
MTRPVSAAFPGTADQVAVARGWLAACLGPGHGAADDAVLLLSEVFGNSVLYGSPNGELVEVGVELAGRKVTVTVTDSGGGGDPVSGSASDDAAEGGRGLFIVEALATDWGFRRLADQRLQVTYTVTG